MKPRRREFESVCKGMGWKPSPMEMPSFRVALKKGGKSVAVHYTCFVLRQQQVLHVIGMLYRGPICGRCGV